MSIFTRPFLSVVTTLVLLALFPVSVFAVQVPESISAEYQVKASFFALPIKARIAVSKLDERLYQASIDIASPLFKVSQKEQAQVLACELRLQSLQSKGKRIGASPWDETVTLSWPEKRVNYHDKADGVSSEYLAQYPPSGFASFFAHQYIALKKNRVHSTLLYTQSAKGWRTDFIGKGYDRNLDNRFFDEPVDAYRFQIPRQGMADDEMPNVWYVPEQLAAFPLRMAMKLGVFRLEVQLKKISASEEAIAAFFQPWGCQ